MVPGTTKLRNTKKWEGIKKEKEPKGGKSLFSTTKTKKKTTRYKKGPTT